MPVPDRWKLTKMLTKENSTIPLLERGAPLPVKMAIGLYAVVWLRGTFYVITELLRDFLPGSYASLTQKEAIATVGLWYIVNAMFIRGMVYQKNWARIAQMGMSIIGFLILCVQYCGGNDFKPGFVYFSEVGATLLLFLPSVGAWFKKRPYP
jgi:hypothetical protein